MTAQSERILTFQVFIHIQYFISIQLQKLGKILKDDRLKETMEHGSIFVFQF